MTYAASAPWHRNSFDRFLYDRLPQLLAARLPLAGYRARSGWSHACPVSVTLSAGAGGDLEVRYPPAPA